MQIVIIWHLQILAICGLEILAILRLKNDDQEALLIHSEGASVSPGYLAFVDPSHFTIGNYGREAIANHSQRTSANPSHLAFVNPSHVASTNL